MRLAPRLVMAIAALFLASPALAQGVADFGSYSPRGRPTESRQDMAVELRVGRYVPSVDDEFSGATPYEETFGTQNRYSVGLEVDWQALRIPYFGTLGPGVGIAYTKSTGRSFVANDRSVRAEESSSLTIFPMYAVGVLRVDYLARSVRIPLVPYAKFGLGAALWSVGDGDGTARAEDSTLGRGISTGLDFALGGMFLLDVLEPDAALEMDATTGVNNSYVFAEWFVSSLNGFGSGEQMQVGTNTWVLGLALEM